MPRHNTDMDSRPVISDQAAPDRRLPGLVRRHQAAPYTRPIAEHTRAAMAWLAPRLVDGCGFILDSGCGTGESTRLLAAQFPHLTVVGADRSAHRLGRGGWCEPGVQEGNVVLMRANLVDLWRLLQQQRLFPQRHYLLYPNPYPKPGQIGRRWHGHPVFPVLIALGGRIELRSNWEIYVREFAQAVELLTSVEAPIVQIRPDHALSAFERKYLQSQHQLFQVVADLRSRGDSHR